MCSGFRSPQRLVSVATVEVECPVAALLLLLAPPTTKSASGSVSNASRRTRELAIELLVAVEKRDSQASVLCR